MAWLLNKRQKRAVAYAEAGRCGFAQAAMRDEFRALRRGGVTNPMTDAAYRRAAEKIRSTCGSTLGRPARKKR